MELYSLGIIVKNEDEEEGEEQGELCSGIDRPYLGLQEETAFELFYVINAHASRRLRREVLQKMLDCGWT